MGNHLIFNNKMVKIVFLRHGESTWNVENKFTGWTDVPLSAKGKVEAKEAGVILKEKGYVFDNVFTSVLERSKETFNLAQEAMATNYVPKPVWRLNERHYGELQGANKAETAAKFGEDQVKIWRRAYDIAPPALKTDDKRHPVNDVLYKDVEKNCLPSTECLKDCVERVLPFWNTEVVPLLKDKKSVLLVAHGNSLRSLCMYLENMTKEQVLELNIPTGIPLVYELNDDDLKFEKSYYLLDEQELKAKLEAVADQGKAN